MVVPVLVADEEMLVVAVLDMLVVALVLPDVVTEEYWEDVADEDIEVVSVVV